MISTALLLLALAMPDLTQNYLDDYFATFPSRATAAGRHDLDDRLEDLGPEERARWVARNHEMARSLRRSLADHGLAEDARLDAELLLAEVERQLFTFETLRRPERDPLFWTDLLSHATVFLLVREDRPAIERLSAAAARAELLPRLANQAQVALASTSPTEISAELCTMAVAQARAAASFYRQGFAQAASDEAAGLRSRMRVAGSKAAVALDRFADFLDDLALRAGGSPRLGEHYARSFELGTGVKTPVDEVLLRAERALIAKRAEAAAFGRGVWPTIFPQEPVPVDDRLVIHRLFARLAEDRIAGADPRGTQRFVEEYRQLIQAAIAFVEERQLLKFPEPFALHVDRSPSYFIGQSVGGVYPAGPYRPDSATLLFVPTPPDSATVEQRDAFFRDFNHHFNVMILPHEIVPGHALQLAVSNRQASKVRALFGDGVYIEGWGTFCERLMLDLGWGTPLARAAHLKKQLENIARTIVDIRVHAYGMPREEVRRFVRDEAFQDDQFASNMWRRAITSSPQLTTYFLGFDELWNIYLEARQKQDEAFELAEFLRQVMALGPVAPRVYRSSGSLTAGSFGSSASPVSASDEEICTGKGAEVLPM